MTISPTDLTSNLVDLTTVPLRDLREARKFEVAAAATEYMASGSLDLFEEIQMQDD